MGKSAKQLKDEVIATLGGGPAAGGAVVQVELTDNQYNMVIDQAMRWFTQRKGFVIFRPIQVNETTPQYVMANDVVNILDVIFQVPSDVAAFFSLGFFDLIPYGPQNIGSIGSGLSNYSGFAQLLEFNQKRKRIFSVDPDWYYEPQTKVLHITARAGTTVGIMLVQCKVSTFEPEQLTGWDEDLFARWVHAKCKQIVGRIRSKYDSMPAAGGNVSLDGKDLIAEAKEEFEQLDKEIFASQGPDTPIAG